MKPLKCQNFALILYSENRQNQRLFLTAKSMKIFNFLFHRVNPSRDVLWDPMSVSNFEKCIKHIASEYEVLRFEDILSLSNNFKTKIYKNNKQLATITFDDGYKDNIEYAAPILKKYQVNASFYIVTSCIDNNMPTWTQQLDYTLLHTRTHRLELNFPFIPDILKKISLNHIQERISYAKMLKPFLKKTTHPNRMLVLEHIFQVCNDLEIPHLMMNWDDIQALKTEGHYIGSHTVTHPALGTITSKELMLNELVNSRERIREKLGYSPLTIAYPFGCCNELVKQLAEKAGYSAGLGVKQNTFDPAKADIFNIPRIELYNEPAWKTHLRIKNSLGFIKNLFSAETIYNRTRNIPPPLHT